MEGITNIYDLPEEKEQQQLQQSQQQSQQLQQSQQSQRYGIDQSTVTELLEGLERIKTTTNLPTRDIPNNPDKLMIDPETVANYIPPSRVAFKDDIFIPEESNNTLYIESVYEDIQMPVFVGILYFVFQLPLMKKYLYYFFPNLFSGEGQFNLGGYVFTSILFSLFYYITNI